MTLTLFALRIVLLLLLYGFLGLLAWLVWRELKQGSSPVRPTSSGVAGGERLTVVEAGDSGYAEGRQFPLGTVTTLGRDLTNEIVVSDAYASGNHARVERQEDGRYWLVDVGSSNGTLLNGRRIRTNDPVPLDRGDVVGIGTVRLKFG